MLVGCATDPQYNFRTGASINGANGKTVKVITPTKTVVATKLKVFFEDLLKNNGFKIVKADKKSQYGFVFGIENRSWQTLKTVPVCGKTGIRSINTNTNGTLSGFYNGSSSLYGNGYASHFGNYQGNYNGYSHTSVEYDYGVTGYHNAVVNNFQIDFTALLMDYKTSEIVYEGHLTGTEYVSEENLAEYVRDVYGKYPFFYG